MSAATEEEGMISLAGIWDAIIKFKFQLLAGVAAVTVVAHSMTLLVTPQWEAVALLQPGQTGQGFLETSVNMVSRMSQPSFILGLNHHVHGSGIDLSDAGIVLLKKSFRGTVVKNSDLIEVRLRAHSPDMAKRLMEEVVANLRLAQHESFVDIVAQLQAQRDVLQKDVQSTKSILKVLSQQMQSSSAANDLLFAGLFLQQKNDELRKLQQDEWLLQVQLSAARTFETRVLNEIYVSEDPVYPKTTLVTLFAFLASLMLGVSIAYFRHVRPHPSSEAK